MIVKELKNKMQRCKTNIKNTSEVSSLLTVYDENMITYNDFICIIIPFKCDFDFSVKFDEFNKVISLLDDDDEIKIVKKDNKIKITSKKTKIKATMKIFESNEVIDIFNSLFDIIESKDKWNDLPTNFMDGVLKCSFSISSDKDDPKLSSLHITKDKIVSSDDFRISEFILDSKMEKTFSLPGTTVKELLKFKNVNFYKTNDSWAIFDNTDEELFCVRLSNTEIITTDSFFETSSKIIKVPAELKEKIKITSVFSDGLLFYDKTILVDIDGETMNCTGENDLGVISDVVFLEGNDKKCKLKINPLFFLEILNASKDLTMAIDETKVLFEMDNFRHIIAVTKGD